MNQLQMRQKANKKTEGRFKSKHINNHSKSLKWIEFTNQKIQWLDGLKSMAGWIKKQYTGGGPKMVEE